MLNIKTATFAQLKQFAAENQLVIEGDKRLRVTWERAVELFLCVKDASVELTQETLEGALECVKDTLTYDNAVIVANWLAAWNDRAGEMLQRFTVSLPKILWSACLVAISLAALAIDLWKEREQTKYDAWTLYHKARLEVKEFFKHRADSASRKIAFEYRFLRFHGDTIFRTNVVRPVMDHRDKVNAMARAAKG